MKKVAIITAILALSLFGFACNKQTADELPEAPEIEVPIEEPVETAAEPQVEEPVEEAKHRYDAPLEGLSPLTGLPYEGDEKAIMIQMENTSKARPHSGLKEADLIYEIEVESTITRLTAFFLSSYPEKVGPVRSARRQHIHLWNEWNYLYVFYGGSTSTPGQDIYELTEELGITAKRVDGTKSSTGYSRSADRVAPHNAYSNLQVVKEKAYDFQPERRTLYFDENLIVEGEAAEKVSLSYRNDNKITYAYSEEKGTYLRTINGEPMIDKETGEQIDVRNIIVQHANHYHVTDTVYTNIDLIGNGVAEYFTEGIMRKGTWERKDADSFTIYYDDAGNEIAFKPGKTFIQIMRNESEVVFE